MNNLRGFTGTEQYYFNPFYKAIKYTDGVKFVGDNKASWLITDILSVLIAEPKVLSEYSEGNFISINFVLDEEDKTKGTATYTDGNENILYSQRYETTDIYKHFQEDKINFFYTNSVLMLSGEY